MTPPSYLRACLILDLKRIPKLCIELKRILRKSKKKKRGGVLFRHADSDMYNRYAIWLLYTHNCWCYCDNVQYGVPSTAIACNSKSSVKITHSQFIFLDVRRANRVFFSILYVKLCVRYLSLNSTNRIDNEKNLCKMCHLKLYKVLINQSNHDSSDQIMISDQSIKFWYQTSNESSADIEKNVPLPFYKLPISRLTNQSND